MSTQRKYPTVRQWLPMRPATPVPKSPEQIRDMLAAAREDGIPEADFLRTVASAGDEVWKNHKYTAHVDRRDDRTVSALSIKRNDRKPIHDWRDLQRIKNDIAGEDTEAVELYPAEDRLVDTANQFFLWVFPPGERLPFGFPERKVAGPEQAARYGAVQRPL